MKRRSQTTLALFAVLLSSAVSAAAPSGPSGSSGIAEYAKGMTRQEGYLPLVWDGTKGRLLVDVPTNGEEFLYLTSASTGLGEPTINIDLDRGSVINQFLAHFERVGPKLHLVARNERFRASGGSAALERSVEESFPTSTLGSFEIVASSGDRVLADLTPLFLSDAVDVRASLRQAGEGNYSLDAGRSRIFLARTKAFPKNSEVEAALTFTSDAPGSKLAGQTPDARTLTLRQHHSFVKLPGPGYQPRAFDPRAGAFNIEYYDFSRPFDRDPVVRLITRHRLQKRDSTAAISEPVEPLVYYLDPAIPEPYRSAFRQGVGWWNRVFEAAGFHNALRIEDMPADMDPMDARYNVIQWLHRDDPGPSVGASLVDPRTGEIIKAAVRMDSYRSLVDYDLYAAMLPAMGKDAGDPDPEAERFVMARRRQHAAHEVGHTLGFAHNFVGAAEGRSSVMAYPGPLVRLTNDQLDLADAYRAGPGAWDTLIVRLAYGDGDQASREQLIREAQARGLHFGTNPDEGLDGSYPATSVWVNGADPVEELARMMAIRRFLLERFDQRAIRPGEPMATLGRRFTEAYLFHGHTLNAAIKAIGGMEYDYAVRGDPGPPTRLVRGVRQRRALELALSGLEPAELAVPERIAVLLAPRPFGYDPDPQSFGSRTGAAFDPLAPAHALAAQTLGGILTPQRCARLVTFATRDSTLPTLEEVIGRIIQRSFTPASGARAAALKRVVQREVVDALVRLDASAEATPETRAGAEWGLSRVRERVAARGVRLTPQELAHRAALERDIDRVLERQQSPTAPPGAPPQPRRPWPSAQYWEDE